MKSVFLSFSPEWYPYIENGKKIYEHRKRFCDEPVVAYLYIGLPIQKIVAILELGKREEITNWLEKYKDDPAAIERIKDCITRNRYAMEIRTIQFIEPISIKTIIDNFPKFHIPQSFFYLDKKPELFDFLKRQIVFKGNKIVNDFSKIDSDDICRY